MSDSICIVQIIKKMDKHLHKTQPSVSSVESDLKLALGTFATAHLTEENHTRKNTFYKEKERQ